MRQIRDLVNCLLKCIDTLKSQYIVSQYWMKILIISYIDTYHTLQPGTSNVHVHGVVIQYNYIVSFHNYTWYIVLQYMNCLMGIIGILIIASFYHCVYNTWIPEFLIYFEAWAKLVQQWLVCAPLGILLEPINKQLMLLVII